MSRLEVITKTKAQSVVDDLYKDLERRIVAAPPGLCPVDMTASFLKLFHTQTCGKCVPCRIGLGLLVEMREDVLAGDAGSHRADRPVHLQQFRLRHRLRGRPDGIKRTGRIP